MTALVSVVNILGSSRIAANLPNAPSWAVSGVLLLGVLGLLNVAAIVAIWTWRRWGVYLLLANTLAIFAINLAILGGTAPFQGLIGAALILFCVYRKWADFE
ncbi:hypothetical protein GJ700_00580 [Duganella sp. FT92W]|uniref:Nicotinamide riboside transporter PnuC n=1 Tax=Pseudoduganella rivuli TaxID=2666085 RepID=A0A7X2LQK8_9BURK|nr:hypothetical protein [Pseudoduganella rivuli]MRV70216.1 hypothetical protein [Pseudoduganella rivuli]